LGFFLADGILCVQDVRAQVDRRKGALGFAYLENGQ
jgi:hypothetical protein